MVGTVESIDLQKTFTIINNEGEKTAIIVTSDTEFEMERGKGVCEIFFAKFSDLRVKDWVKNKSYQTLNAEPLQKK